MTEFLHYTREGHGRAVVLLHPIGLDHSFWGSFAKTLSIGHSVVALDLRGHGKSPAAKAGLWLADYADDVASLIDKLELGPATVVGLSFGGMIAQSLAVRRPDLVSCLALCGCASRFPDQVRAQIAERGELAAREGMAAVVDTTLARWFTPEFLRASVVDDVRKRLLANDTLGWHVGWQAISALNTHPENQRIKVPTLCLAGDIDQAVSPAAVQDLAASIPGARFEALNRTPHMMQIEREDLFTGVIVDFLRATA